MPKGIPRSRFLGRIDGPDWTDEDRHYAMAWVEFNADLCSSCAQHYADSTAKKNQYAYEGEIVRCHACAATQRTQQKFEKEGGDMAGVMFRFTTKPE